MAEKKYSAKLATEICGCIAQTGVVEKCLKRFEVNENTWFSWLARKQKTLGTKVEQAVLTYQQTRLRPLELSMIDLAERMKDEARDADKPGLRAYLFSVVQSFLSREDRKAAQRAGREDAKFDREIKRKRLALEERRVAALEANNAKVDSFKELIDQFIVVPKELGAPLHGIDDEA